MTGSYRVSGAISRISRRQYRVTEEPDTEPPFDNELADPHQADPYVDELSAEPLLASAKTYDGGSRWPGSTAPLEPVNVGQNSDVGVAMISTEVLRAWRLAPWPRLQRRNSRRGGFWYCVNCAAFRFVAYEQIDAQG